MSTVASGAPTLDAGADEVVGWLLGPRHRSCLDTTGRPLGEQASPRYGVTCEVLEEVRLFRDARDETAKPCNVLALRQLSGCWASLGRALSSYQADAPNTVGRMYRRADAARRLAPLLAIRAEPVSPRAAALYKVALGFSELLSALLIEETIDADDAPPNEETLDQWLDEGRWLIGERQVCAGSRSQIRSIWSALATDAEDDGVFPEWNAPWFEAAASACLTLEALAAASAGAARFRGQQTRSVATELYLADDAPRLVGAIQRFDDAHGLHATLLFESTSVPAALRSFVDAVAEGRTLDDALVLAAQEPLASLLASLGRPREPLSEEAFRRACA